MSCNTPCTLDLPIGSVHVVVESHGRSWGRFQTDVQVPPSPSLVRLKYSGINGYIWGGIGLGLGVPTMIVGAYFLWLYNPLVTSNALNDDYLLAGALCVAVGIALIAVGTVDIALANHHQAELSVTGPGHASRRTPVRLSLGAAPLVGGGGTASLAVLF
jgi:hypothetical protein